MNVFTLPIMGATLAALWAALLALAEGALAADPRLGATALPRPYAEQPERLRHALAIGRIVLLALAAMALSGAVRWWQRPPLAAALWLVLLVAGIVVAADLLPRFAGLWKAAGVGRWAVRLTAASLALPAPIFIAAGVIDRALARLFGVTERRSPAGDVAQREMLLGVFALADTMVSEVMTPRVDVLGLDVREPFESIVSQVAAAEHSRLPVFEGDLDHIVGVLSAKDLLQARFGQDGGGNWRRLVRPVEVVPEVKTLDRQLRDFQRGPGHMAVVVDEFGGTAGIVTLEDVLEEVVGEIVDEYDLPPDRMIARPEPGVLVVDGRTGLAQLAAAMGEEIEHEEVTTAGGWVYGLFGHVPQAGESARTPNWVVTVEKVEKRRISRVRLERIPPAAEQDGGARGEADR